VKHPHQLLPKLFQPVRLLRAEFPFPLQRGCRGIVFPVLLRRLALIVIGCGSGGFLAFRQQATDEGFTKLHQQPQTVAFLIGRPERGSSALHGARPCAKGQFKLARETGFSYEISFIQTAENFNNLTERKIFPSNHESAI
jgi:hypothetical protein